MNINLFTRKPVTETYTDQWGETRTYTVERMTRREKREAARALEALRTPKAPITEEW
jgi:hypothetical protein